MIITAADKKGEQAMNSEQFLNNLLLPYESMEDYEKSFPFYEKIEKKVSITQHIRYLFLLLVA